MTDPSASPPLLARGLSKDFGQARALDTLDLEVAAGEIVCLLGQNGAGKTTTINLFLGFLRPSHGTVAVCGIDVVRDPGGARRQLAYVPEQLQLYPTLTGLENLEYLATLGGAARRARGSWLTMLGAVGLGAADAERRVSTYSKGMRQKIGLALALARESRALLLDEPTSGLDPEAANEFEALLAAQAARGAAVLMVTHDLYRAKQTSRRIGIMRRGRLVAMLRTADVDHVELERLYLEQMRRAA